MGTPIRGGAAPADAPEIRPGQYLDTYERGAPPAEDGTRKFYAVQLKPGDTPHFSATIAPPAVRASNITALMVQLAIVDAEGESCGPSSNGGADVAVFGKVTAQTAVLDPPPVGDRPWRESCSAGDRPLYVQVTRGGSAFGTQQLPVELAFRLEPAVRDAGPPAIVAMAEKLPAPASAPARPVEAGTSFNDAPVLSPGTYRDSITTGETRYFRVPLGWGQRLAYRVSIPTQGLPIQTAALYAVLASPLRAKAEQVTDSGTYELLGGKTDQEVSGSSAVPVRYLNRESSLSAADEYSVDGTYYLVLDLSYRLGKDEPVSFPFTLTVATSGGEPGPAYLTDPEPGGGGTASPTAPPTVAASPASTGGSGSGGSGRAGAVGAGRGRDRGGAGRRGTRAALVAAPAGRPAGSPARSGGWVGPAGSGRLPAVAVADPDAADGPAVAGGGHVALLLPAARVAGGGRHGGRWGGRGAGTDTTGRRGRPGRRAARPWRCRPRRRTPPRWQQPSAAAVAAGPGPPVVRSTAATCRPGRWAGRGGCRRVEPVPGAGRADPAPAPGPRRGWCPGVGRWGSSRPGSGGSWTRTVTGSPVAVNGGSAGRTGANARRAAAAESGRSAGSAATSAATTSRSGDPVSPGGGASAPPSGSTPVSSATATRPAAKRSAAGAGSAPASASGGR